MMEKYPFFREEDERTQAVIGEDAIASDLEGTYQKPYAVLTQKRLYCKNEQGNYIIDTRSIASATKETVNIHSKIFWITAIVFFVLFILIYFTKQVYVSYGYEVENLMDEYGHAEIIEGIYGFSISDINGMLRGFRFANTILILCGAIFVLFLVLGFRKLHKCASLIASLGGAVGSAWYLLESPFFKQWPNSKIFGYVCLVFSTAVLSLGLIYFLQSRKIFNTFNIYHSTGVFPFRSTLYSVEELKNFERQVKALRGSKT